MKVLKLSGLALALALSPVSADDSVSVLFIGNSHTYVNDLPGLFIGLSRAGGKVAAAEQSTVGGYSLQEHAAYAPTLEKIAQGNWDHVVLQEQSQIPTIEFWLVNGMFPAARFLDSLIVATGNSTALYMTWGWRNGGTMTYRGYSSPPFRNYFEMQDSVSSAYSRLAHEVPAALVPVGRAWARARELDSLVDLWQVDDCHATLQGTYLAACVFYAVLHQADPTGLDFTGGLPAQTARFCQQVAWQVVSGVIESETRSRTAVEVPLIFPNPCSGRFLVRLPRATGGSKRGCCRIEVRDAAGRLLRSLSVAGNGRDVLVPVDLGLLRSGLVFVQVGAGAPVKVVCRRPLRIASGGTP